MYTRTESRLSEVWSLPNDSGTPVASSPESDHTWRGALRGVALGRKNYLFCGSDAGGQAAAAIYSLIGTAKLNDIDPENYLQRVLEKIADLPITRIHELLPWNFVAPQPDLGSSQVST